jgi:glycosyltransferase involved in cell wall biosynthesis
MTGKLPEAMELPSSDAAVRALVSYVIPTFNRSTLVVECLEACVRQTHRPLELVVVDDGSTDDTVQRVQQRIDENDDTSLAIILVRQSNRGVSAARNAGMSVASGEFIGFVDSDDWIPPSRTARMLAVAHQYGADLVYGDCGPKQARGCIYRETPQDSQLDCIERTVGGDWAAATLMPLVVCFLAQRDLVQRAGAFHEDLFVMEDFEWVIRLKIFARRIVKLRELVYVQHASDDSLLLRHSRDPRQRLIAEERIVTTLFEQGRLDAGSIKISRRRLYSLARAAFRRGDLLVMIRCLFFSIASLRQ